MEETHFEINNNITSIAFLESTTSIVYILIHTIKQNSPSFTYSSFSIYSTIENILSLGKIYIIQYWNSSKMLMLLDSYLSFAHNIETTNSRLY